MPIKKKVDINSNNINNSNNTNKPTKSTKSVKSNYLTDVAKHLPNQDLLNPKNKGVASIKDTGISRKQHIIYYALSILAIVLVAFVIYDLAYLSNLNPNNDKDINYSNDVGNYVLADYGDDVKVYYTLYVDNQLIESNYDSNEPLIFTIGAKQMIKGFEQGIVGMQEGQEKTIFVSPKDGYGSDVQDINVSWLYVYGYARSQIEQDFNADQLIGTTFFAGNSKCKLISFDVTTDIARMQCKHKFADSILQFKIKLIQILKNDKPNNLVGGLENDNLDGNIDNTDLNNANTNIDYVNPVTYINQTTDIPITDNN